MSNSHKKRKKKMAEKHWMQDAVKKPGSFTKKAEEHGDTAQEFAKHVEANPEDYSTHTERQASLARTFEKEGKKNEKHDKEHEHEREERHEEEKEQPKEHERRLEGEKESKREEHEHEEEGAEKRTKEGGETQHMKVPLHEWLNSPRRERKKKEG